MVHFHETKMGERFYRQTMPDIAKSLQQIAKTVDDALEIQKEITMVELADTYEESIPNITAERYPNLERLLKLVGFIE